MKSTGIVRKLDELGRVVLPIELRRNFNINEKDSLEVYVDEDKIILRKYNPGCKCCGSVERVMEIQGLRLCENCLSAIKKAALQKVTA
ncbi:AbrB/MazE/SpoVT family DNA-binding domain-containing protein [Dehalobacter sp.]|uniref:AbrB/MazE/SpoVT family DNA-binding domain-containing protein n=1 Tax=Dehalobacter sp. TaxID=1962289 RepID=UPI002588E4D1|nr:AbrB/MazE/SpoVT family DNA-binding domain-containing protein [Dehalobacter sp.]MDJ0305367.1 AbrB/MazE/SpoVT family DNA-binding domain-containing protein [Dehalobacter sp.]